MINSCNNIEQNILKKLLKIYIYIYIYISLAHQIHTRFNPNF